MNDEEMGMTNQQYKGIIQMIITMLKDNIPKEKIVEYLEELIKTIK